MIKVLLFSLSMFTCAASASLAPPEGDSPEAALKGTVDQLLVNLKLHAPLYRKDQKAFYAMVNEQVVPRFDVAGIARFALGAHGRAATPEQRQQFADTLALSLVHSYADVMLERFDSMTLAWSPARPIAADSSRAKINSVLAGTGGEHFLVGFSVRLVDGAWKIYDLEIEGVSLAVNYRAQLGVEIKRTSLDAVIARLHGKERQKIRSTAL
jgi:phospholipid transport system substrate-binding protein